MLDASDELHGDPAIAELITPTLQAQVRQAHPEVTFLMLVVVR